MSNFGSSVYLKEKKSDATKISVRTKRHSSNNSQKKKRKSLNLITLWREWATGCVLKIQTGVRTRSFVRFVHSLGRSLARDTINHGFMLQPPIIRYVTKCDQRLCHNKFMSLLWHNCIKSKRLKQVAWREECKLVRLKEEDGNGADRRSGYFEIYRLLNVSSEAFHKIFSTLSLSLYIASIKMCVSWCKA